MIENEDNKIVEEVSSGNISAFGKLIKKYQSPLFNLAIRMVKDYEDARDITQNTFIKAYEKLMKFDKNQKFFSWLYRIAINESLNFLKSKKSFNPVDDENLANEDNPEEIYIKKERHKELNDALMELNPEYRAIIILKHLQELSYREISEIMGITEDKVKSRLFSARKTLNETIIKSSEIRNGK